MKIGTYYYPEQWPRDQWERDFDNIAKLGLRIVHMGEFAWHTMEPSPGEIVLDWLEECVEMAAERQLDVILCTPSAAPPIWLSQQHPEVLPIENGRPHAFGGRRHYSPTSKAMRDATAHIVTALADRFGDHEAIIGWQIDNEYGAPFNTNDHTHAAFREWLRKKYHTIGQLNRAWGNQFWNTYYTNFDQILMPPGREPHYDNPHHHLDASRFWSWAFADFNRMQARILKPKIGERFVTTNFMPLHLDCDPADMAEDLTLFSWDSYPVHGWDKHPTDQTFRIADPNGIGLMHDHMASFNGRWGLMELQPGQVNWSGVPVHLYPGAVRLWIWNAFAHGAEFVTTYRYRQPRFGIELFHHGLVDPDGVTPSAGGKQFAQVCKEIRKLDLAKVPPLVEEPIDAGNTAGLVLDFEQLWYYATLPQSRKWKYPEFLRVWYGAIARLGMRVCILHPKRPWPEGIKLLVAPGIQMIDDELVGRLDDFARDGGHLVLTCRTGLMDRHGQLWEGPLAKPLVSLVGATITGYDGLPDDAHGTVAFAHKTFQWNAWADLLAPAKETEVLGKYTDQFYSGTAAMTRRPHGDAGGTVTYCGACSMTGDLYDSLLEKIVADARLGPAPLPNRLRLHRRGPYTIALNWRDIAVPAPAPKEAKFLVGARTIEPAGVAVWET
jgi:beta-galactosidase